MFLERSIAWPKDLVVYQQQRQPPLRSKWSLNVVLFGLVHMEEFVFGSKPLGNTIIKL